MIKVGNVVLSTAGKERGQIYVVVALDDKFAYLSDGKRLRANKPKRKSFKHIKQITLKSLSEEEVNDSNERINARIRKFLSEIRSENV